MADRIESFPVVCSGGLITNMSPIEQAKQAPGSARELVNFECSLKGGYRRIKGYRKINDTPVPRFATMLSVGQTSSGSSSIVVADPFEQMGVNITFTIQGDSTVYTVTSKSYSVSTRQVTVGVNPVIQTLKADKLPITITGNVSSGAAYAQLYRFYPMLANAPVSGFVSSAYGYQVFSADIDPADTDYYSSLQYFNGTTLVNGAGQTGTTLVVDGLQYTPVAGDTFYIANVSGVYAVVAANPIDSNGGTSLVIDPALASTPANNAPITWYHSASVRTNVELTSRNLFCRFYVDGIENIIFVNGLYPVLINPQKGYRVINSNNEVYEATSVAYYKDQAFYGVKNKVVFSAKYDVESFSAADGAGVLTIDGSVTGLRAFREQLIIFTTSKIYRLVGNSVDDFRKEPITERIGCLNPHSIQEVGGDLAFQTNDGIRMLGATEKLGDFNLASITNSVQDKISAIIAPAANTSDSTYQTSVVINAKNQYRIFRFSTGETESTTLGLIGTLKPSGQFEWSETYGLSVWSADYNYGFIGFQLTGEGKVEEMTVFCNGYDPYLYQMDYGNTFDGTNITATYSTPYFTFNDPKMRKTLYSLSVSTERNVDIAFTASVLLDFNESNVIQPASIAMGNTAGIIGDNIGSSFETTLIGNGNNASISFVSTAANTDFSFKDLTIEYSTNDRR